MKKLILIFFVILSFSFANLKAETKITDPVLYHILLDKFEATYYYFCPRDGWSTSNHTGSVTVRCKICNSICLPVRI
jgi:hypothetical protein